MDLTAVESLIRDVPDFPRPGILFKDITPVLQKPEAFEQCIVALVEAVSPYRPDLVIGIESRGFIFGAPLALRLGRSFVPVRKVGKLPAETLREDYDLEYGTNSVEIHTDAVPPGARVVIVDDLLATGGTAAATARLVSRLGGVVVGCAFLVELSFLNGRDQLSGIPVASLIRVE